MKRFALALSLCAALLTGLSIVLFPSANAAENPLLTLLNLPAPPPLNPQVPLVDDSRSSNFYDKSHPPADNSSIDDLLDYWKAQSSGYAELGYNPKPSDKALDRILAEVEKDHAKVYQYLNVFRGSKKAAELVKEIYDRTSAGNEYERNNRSTLKRWLTYNTSYFSSDLARDAARAHDANEYVDHQEAFLSLGRVDWERARPIVDRLYNGSGKVSRVLAQWALYRNALDNDSLDDIERYRNELRAVVEDKTATDGMRDLAFDALVKEKEWNGRDEWYYSLLSDETLDELRVDGRTYTGLTTIMYYTPTEKYTDKMIELSKSDNKTVRTAAVKNLLRRLNGNNPEVVRALLPWISDPKWITGDDSGRAQVVSALQFVKVPESVPALLAALDEKISVTATTSNSMSNAKGMSRANVAMQAEILRSQSGASNNAAVNSNAMRSEMFYPMRHSAIPALAYQEDPRAVPALRRILNEASQPYERTNLVAALFKCHGFTVLEQVDALEQVARESEAAAAALAAANIYAANTRTGWWLPTRDGDITHLLGAYIASMSMSDQPSNEVTKAAIDRIVDLDRTDPKTSKVMRRIVMGWLGTAVNSLLMRDLKNNRVETDAVLRLLVLRKELRETQQADVYDMRTGNAISLGISACILEDPNDYDSILSGSSDATKTAMLACARLIRSPLPVEKVATLVNSKDKLLALAAERYLESEDSPEARRVVLSLHPNEAFILGATTAFYPGGEEPMSNNFLYALFASISPYHAAARSRPYAGGGDQRRASKELEQRLREEVKQSPDLLGIYSYDWGDNFIRIYKDKAVFSWENDPARYRERVLTPDEFERFKGILSHYKADEMPPYIGCPSDNCQTRQLLMLGRNGGRRVFMVSPSPPPFFAELDRSFEEMRSQPAAIKYWASKQIPGLEVLFADDNLDAVTVWNNGADLRLLVADKAKRAEIDAEIEEFAANLPEDQASSEDESDYDGDPRIYKERFRRTYENYGWRSLSAGELGAVVSQPAQSEFIPLRDGFAVSADNEAWKARAGATEVRVDEKGIYKISAGKITRIQDGYYESPIITPDGRWVVTVRYDNERGGELVRINLQTKKQSTIASEEYPVFRAVAWIPSVARVLLGPRDNEYDYADSNSDSSSNLRYAFLDPETGLMTPVTGDVRPLAQQTFRSLQALSNAFDFWVAIPGENETTIGIYNTRVFAVRTVLKVPKIKFDSMKMWVDEAGGKTYIVYEGQLLSVPMKTK